MLELDGHLVSVAHNSEEASNLALNSFDAIVCNLRLNDKPATSLLKHTTTPVLFMSSHASDLSQDEVLKYGSIDYLQYPPQVAEIREALALVWTDQYRALTDSRREPRHDELPVTGMIGSCPAMQELFRHIRKIGATDAAVLITGESGTGKELVARALHEASPRSNRPMHVMNCAAVPPEKMSTMLFGMNEQDDEALVKLAHKGTLFLDEINELPIELQARLVQTIELSHFRLIGATQRDLKPLVRDAMFREDLFYRINVMSLRIPPLRERGMDVLELADRFLNRVCERNSCNQKYFSADTVQAITTYDWPGNVRELENAIERSVVLSESDEIELKLLNLDIELKYRAVTQQHTENPVSDEVLLNHHEQALPNSGQVSLEEYFRRFVLSHQGEFSETALAQKLGISRKCLWERRQRFNLPRPKKL
jgi:DNA-binding NtrC family response regulator